MYIYQVEIIKSGTVVFDNYFKVTLKQRNFVLYIVDYVLYIVELIFF